MDTLQLSGNVGTCIKSNFHFKCKNRVCYDECEAYQMADAKILQTLKKENH